MPRIHPNDPRYKTIRMKDKDGVTRRRRVHKDNLSKYREQRVGPRKKRVYEKKPKPQIVIESIQEEVGEDKPLGGFAAPWTRYTLLFTPNYPEEEQTYTGSKALDYATTVVVICDEDDMQEIMSKVAEAHHRQTATKVVPTIEGEDEAYTRFKELVEVKSVWHGRESEAANQAVTDIVQPILDQEPDKEPTQRRLEVPEKVEKIRRAKPTFTKTGQYVWKDPKTGQFTTDPSNVEFLP